MGRLKDMFGDKRSTSFYRFNKVEIVDPLSCYSRYKSWFDFWGYEGTFTYGDIPKEGEIGKIVTIGNDLYNKKKYLYAVRMEDGRLFLFGDGIKKLK